MKPDWDKLGQHYADSSSVGSSLTPGPGCVPLVTWTILPVTVGCFFAMRPARVAASLLGVSDWYALLFPSVVTHA
jgi:hypothetical protein